MPSLIGLKVSLVLRPFHLKVSSKKFLFYALQLHHAGLLFEFLKPQSSQSTSTNQLYKLIEDHSNLEPFVIHFDPSFGVRSCSQLDFEPFGSQMTKIIELAKSIHIPLPTSFSGKPIDFLLDLVHWDKNDYKPASRNCLSFASTLFTRLIQLNETIRAHQILETKNNNSEKNENSTMPSIILSTPEKAFSSLTPDELEDHFKMQVSELPILHEDSSTTAWFSQSNKFLIFILLKGKFRQLLIQKTDYFRNLITRQRKTWSLEERILSYSMDLLYNLLTRKQFQNGVGLNANLISDNSSTVVTSFLANKANELQSLVSNATSLAQQFVEHASQNTKQATETFQSVYSKHSTTISTFLRNLILHQFGIEDHSFLEIENSNNNNSFGKEEILDEEVQKNLIQQQGAPKSKL